MALDILGPASALNSVTTRPTQTTTYGATRTWFKNCTSLTTQDGTELTNDFLNNALAQFRTAFDGTGIVEDNGDDMLYRAIQSIGIRYGTDTGTVNALAVTFSPPVTVLNANLTMAVVVANTNTAIATIAINGLGGLTPIVGNDGNPLAQGQMVAGQVALLQYNAGKCQLLNPVTPKLSANATYYVNGTTGSDTLYDGTSATVSGTHGPFATIQRAVNQVPLVNLNGFSVTINVADGSYTGPSGGSVILEQVNGSGTVFLVGDVANPQNCQVTSTAAAAAAFFQNAGGSYNLSGFRVSATGAGASDGVASNFGQLVAQNMRFGPCARYHISGSRNGSVALAGTITIEAGANAVAHIEASLAGAVNLVNGSSPPTLNILGAVAFSDAFATANFAGSIQIFYASITGASSVSGPKFDINMNGLMSTFGNGTAYLPGTTSGAAVTTGGQYPS
jgi:hypothetical protein